MVLRRQLVVFLEEDREHPTIEETHEQKELIQGRISSIANRRDKRRGTLNVRTRARRLVEISDLMNHGRPRKGRDGIFFLALFL